MNRLNSFKPALRVGVGLVVAMVIYAASIVFVTGQDAKPADTKAPDAKPADAKPADAKPAEAKPAEAKADANAKAPPPAAKVEKKKLTGAELYSINCNRCHAERYPTEFTSAQWKTLMTHMRVRANLPAAQAKLILKYLQEDSGN